MTEPSISDRDFARLFSEIGPRELARRSGLDYRNIMRRRDGLEARHHFAIKAPASPRSGVHVSPASYPWYIPIDIRDGCILVGSDWHIWPGRPSTMHRAFVRFCRELEPACVIANGDVIDAASIGYPSMQWERRPSVQQEIGAAQDRLAEIQSAIPRRCRTIWTLGNHDARFEKRLAQVAPEYARVAGVHLKDHFPTWEPTFAVHLNDRPGGVIVRHRFKGGDNAPRNNAVKSGRSMVTGHLHSAQVMPLTNANETLWGVDTGCIADPWGQQFVYTEGTHYHWRSAFAVLTFKDGRLLQPELCLLHGPNQVDFRGQIHEIPQAPVYPKVAHGKAQRKTQGRNRRRTNLHRRTRRAARGRAKPR